MITWTQRSWTVYLQTRKKEIQFEKISVGLLVDSKKLPQLSPIKSSRKMSHYYLKSCVKLPQLSPINIAKSCHS
jgi:hypothetical protein